MVTYYAHSGKFSLFGVLSALVTGLALAASLGFVYAYVKLWNPFELISAFAGIGFGAILGYVTGKFLRRGRVRNNAIAIGIGAVSGIAGVYMSWAVWLNQRLHHAGKEWNPLSILTQPSLLWSVDGFIWLFDAAIILTMAIALSRAAVNDPFCEACDRWCETLRDAAKLNDVDRNELRRQLENHRFDFLETLGAKNEHAMAWIRLDLGTCPRCRMTNAISAYRVELRFKRGKRSESTLRLLRWLIISPGEADTLQRISHRMRASA